MSIPDLLNDLNPWWQDGDARRARGYPYQRLRLADLLSRAESEDRRATLLIGPRQVGKTVLLLQLADSLLDRGYPPRNITYFDFSDERVTGEVTARHIVEAKLEGRDPERPQIFLLDEIRGSRRWDLWLKQAVDHRVGKIVATDSAVGLLREGARESGQGRWDEVSIEGLSFREFVGLHGAPGEAAEETLRSRTDLEKRYLALGGFPEHALSYDLPEARRRLRSDVVDRAIERDLARAGVDLQRVKDLFVYLVQASGAELNAEARGRDVGADARTVREWLGLLEETLLIRSLVRRTTKPAAGLRARQKRKYFASDPGLIPTFAAAGPEGLQPLTFEAAVFRHLREIAPSVFADLSYFRPEAGDQEIDFVLAWGRNLIAVEVKSGRRLRGEEAGELSRAAKALGATKAFLIHGGPLGQSFEGVEAVTLRSFLLDPEIVLR